MLNEKNEKEKIHLTAYQKQVKELYEQNLSNQKIAEELGRPYSSVATAIKKLKKMGLINNKRTIITDYQNEIKELYNKGLEVKEIATQLERPENSIKQIIKRLEKVGEITLRPTKQIRMEKVKELYYKGLTREEIASELKVSVGTIYNILGELKENGEIDTEITPYRKKVKEMYEEGINYKQIAKELNRTPYAISKVLTTMKKQGLIENKKQKQQEKSQLKQAKETLKRFHETITKTEELETISSKNIQKALEASLVLLERDATIKIPDLKIIDVILQINTGDIKLLTLLSKCYLKQKRYTRAVAMLNRIDKEKLTDEQKEYIKLLEKQIKIQERDELEI